MASVPTEEVMFRAPVASVSLLCWSQLNSVRSCVSRGRQDGRINLRGPFCKDPLCRDRIEQGEKPIRACPQPGTC